MNKTILATISLSLAALLFTGCAQHSGAYAPKNTEGSIEDKESFVLLDKDTQHSVTVSQIQKQTLTDGRLKVMANVRNLENRRIQVQINCVFKDESGFPVDETVFRTLILTENAQEGVEFISLNPQAKKFTIRVRQAR